MYSNGNPENLGLWRGELEEIRLQSQKKYAFEDPLAYEDVTGRVLEVADYIWGEHSISDEMRIVAFENPIVSPYLLLRDREIPNGRETGNLQGGYLKKSGLVVVQNPGLVREWLQEWDVPAESPLAVSSLLGKTSLIMAWQNWNEARKGASAV